MRDACEAFELALIADRVARRTAGYGGWDPPEEKGLPDPSEMWDSAIKLFPHHLQKLLGKPREKIDEKFGDVTVKLTAEAALSEESGVELNAVSMHGEDADEDGPYGYARDDLDYTLWCDARSWSGEGERELKQHLREFENYLEKHDPAGHDAFVSAH